MELGALPRAGPDRRPDMPDREVSEQFACYDMLAARRSLDEAGRLLGAISVDDVVDRMLGAGWRQRSRRRRDDRDRRRRREAAQRPHLAAPARAGSTSPTTPTPFGQFSESIARFLGTARFLVWQTVVIIVWMAFNMLPPEKYQFDPWDRGLVLLTLVLSLQAVVRGAADPARPEPPGTPRPRSPSDTTARSPSARRPTPSSSPARSPACAWRCPTS